MKCDIYKSRQKKGWYLFIASGTSIENLPLNVRNKLGNLQFFKEISIEEDSPLIAADPKEVMNNINARGYHIQGARVVSSIAEVGAAIGGGILGASIAGPVGAIIGASTGFIAAHSAKGDKDDS